MALFNDGPGAGSACYSMESMKRCLLYAFRDQSRIGDPTASVETECEDTPDTTLPRAI